MELSRDGWQRRCWGGYSRPLRELHGWSWPFSPQVFDAEGAELLACKRAVLLAKEAQVQKLVLEMDNSGVGQKLMREELDCSVHGHIVNEIRSTLGSFEDHSV
jgi:hypothetical protein